MASLKDLASRVKEYLTPKPLVSPIVGQQPVKKTFANDNEGWIRGGKFTPGQQLGEIKQNFSNWQASNRQALQQPLPQSLQPAAKFMGIDKPRTPGILSPLAGMQRFELPSFNTPYKGINFIGNLAKAFPETIINTPRNIAVGGGRIEEEIRNAKSQGRQVDASAILKGLAPLAEGTYDLATFGLTAPIKNIVKEGAEYGLKQAVKKGTIKGATIGGFGGLTYGIDKQYEKDFDLVEVAQSVLGGSLLGGTIGGASGAVGHIKGLLNVPKEVAGQLRELNGRYKAGDTPVKPKGMTKAQWDFQIKFNSKYKRNPYEPVTYQDMKKAFDYEVGKRAGLQARDINQDKKPLSYEGIQDKGLTPEVTNTPSSQQSTISQLSPSPIVPKQQVSPLDSIIDPKAKLSALYKQAGDKFGEAHYQVLSEMDVSYAGKRGKYSSYSSGFPQWVSPELRDKKLFDKVMSNVLDPDNIVQPKVGSKEYKLQDEILGEIESRSGIDGSPIRSQLAQSNIKGIKISSARPQTPKTPMSFYLAEPKPKSNKLTEAEYRKSVREGLGATLTKEQLLDKQVSNIAKMIQESTEKGIQRRLSGKGATVFLAEPSTKKMIQDQKVMANDAYKDWQSQLFKQEGTLTREQLLKKQISSIGDQIKTNTAGGGVPASDIKDISGFKSYTRDIYRNFQEAYGSKFEDIKRTLLDPFDRAKGNLSRSYEKWAGRVNKEVEIDLGIKKGSKESAAVQLFGEGKIKPSQLIEQFGRDKAEKIVNADRWFRTEYDKLLDEVNGVMARIYPNNPEKIIPKRSDYYRHFREMGNSITGLLNIFDSPSNISSSLAGTSEFVKPRSKWLSFAQKRIGDQSDIDAVGGFIDYIKAAEYNKNIDPFTNQFRRLAEDLAIQTEKDPKLNNFIEYLNDFSNDLAGKTNPADRFVQKIIPGGRKTMSVINWLNNRVKANTIVGNLSSTVAQIFNIPQGIADAGVGNSTKGLGLSISNIFGEATPIKKSDFITERYGGGAFDRFDRSMVDNVKKGAVWITGVLDEVGTKYIWNSQYAKALSENIPNPIKFADDKTRALVAGRGIGEVPLIQKSKIFQLVAPFQLEVGNLWHVMGDWVGEKKFGKLATFFIASHLFNKAAEQIRGSDVSIDPIQASMDAYNTYSEEEDKKLGSLKAIGRIGGEVLSNIPGAQSAAAVYPEFGFEAGGIKFPTREEFFGEGDPTRFGSGLLLTKGLQDPLYKIIPPFGGNQLKRTIQGQQATNRGYSESATGRVRFPTEDTPVRNLQRAVFGEYSTPAAREYFKNDTSVLGEKQSETFKSLSPDKAKEYYQNIIQKRGLEKEKDKLKKDLESQGKSSVNQVYAGEEMPLSISKDQLDVEKLKFEMSDEQTRQIGDGVFLLRTESGNPSVIDITKEIPEPKYSGNEAMDKKRKTAYKSALSRRGTDIVKLVDSGLLTEEQGQALMDEVEIKYSGTLKTKKPKSIKIKSVKYNTPKLTKTARKSAPKISISTANLPKSIKRNITISKPKQISVKGFKNTLSSSVKLA